MQTASFLTFLSWPDKSNLLPHKPLLHHFNTELEEKQKSDMYKSETPPPHTHTWKHLECANFCQKICHISFTATVTFSHYKKIPFVILETFEDLHLLNHACFSNDTHESLQKACFSMMCDVFYTSLFCLSMAQDRPSPLTAFLNHVFYSAFVLDDDNRLARRSTSVSVRTVWRSLVTCHHLQREI